MNWDYFPRNISQKNFREAFNLTLETNALVDSLAEWWRRKGNLSSDEACLCFFDWMCKKIDDISYCLGARTEDPPAMEIVEALCVNAIGDPVAIHEGSKLADAGFQTDTNCYVEDAVVYSSLWLVGPSADNAYDMAKAIAETFKSHGYATDIYVDEEDDTQVTVNASVDFDFFYKEVLPKVRSL